MARRSDHSRAQLKTMILVTARRIVARQGIERLNARAIATEIGYSPGTLYNVFENLDDIVLHINAETLDALQARLQAEIQPGDPERVLMALGRAYIEFTFEERRLWNTLFEFRLAEGHPLPDWYEAKIDRLFDLIETTMAPLFGPGEQQRRHRAARILWASLHGICSLLLARQLSLVVDIPAEDMLKDLVSNYVAGIRARATA